MTSTNWNEAEHPRDENGKFTFKNVGSSSNRTVREMIEKQNKEREKFERMAEILYPNMKIKGKSYETPPIAPRSEYGGIIEERHRNPEDILYPTMKNKGDFISNNPAIIKHLNAQLGGGVFNEYLPLTNYIDTHFDKDIKQQNAKNDNNVEAERQRNSRQNFGNAIEIVFQNEGGFSDNKNDFGGKTNMGITQKTYNDYCKRHGMSTKDVKELTREEAREIYYNDYWKPSGADKIKDTAGATILFDTAVLHGVGRAKQFYRESGGNFEKMIELRNQHYDNLVKKYPSQQQNLNGWKNRTKRLSDMLNKEK